jgi:hypothetical protein
MRILHVIFSGQKMRMKMTNQKSQVKWLVKKKLLLEVERVRRRRKTEI